MSNSLLVNYTKISPNSNPRKNNIKKITIHHMAGNLSVETCGNVFASTSRQASSNYGVGSDGRIGMYVEEKNRAWTSSSPNNDHQAVTIEVANDSGAPNWHVSDTALEATINLCVDICKRNNISSLNYTGNSNGNLTRHDMFKNTNCPGSYLGSKFSYIAEEVNKRLNGGSSSQSSSSNSNASNSATIKYVYNCDELNVRTGAGTNYKAVNSLACRTAVKVYEVVNGWARIEKGMWVSNRYLASRISNHIKSMEVYNCSSLNVRKTPNGTIVGNIPVNCVVSVLGTRNGWTRIGANRWVYSKYLK